MHYKSQLGPFMQHPYELLMENASGEPLHVEMSLASIHFKGIWNAIAIFRDVTAHVQEERRERESWINAVLQGSPIPQFMIDTNHTIIFWNRALEEYTGIKAGDIIGTKQQWRVFYDTERPCLADLLLDNAAEEIPRWVRNKIQ